MLFRSVTSARRLPVLPDVPTVAESGVPGYESASWYGALLPAATPAAIVATLNREMVRAIHSPDVRDRLIAGAMVPGAFVAKAQKFRRWYHDAIVALFSNVDVILAPTTPCRAPRIGQATMSLGGVEMLVRPNLGVFTQPISFIGLPVVSVPIWAPGEHLPLGVQIIAAPWREDIALKVAHALERKGLARAPVAK